MIDQRDIQYHLHYRGAELARKRDQEALRQLALKSRRRGPSLILRTARALIRWSSARQNPPEPEFQQTAPAVPAVRTPAAPCP